VEPLTIVVTFDVDKQVTPGSIPGFVASVVHEFGFDRAKAAFHWALPFADYSIELCSTELLTGFAQQIPFRLMDWTIPAALRTLR
jgi:hypothetical protein